MFNVLEMLPRTALSIRACQDMTLGPDFYRHSWNPSFFERLPQDSCTQIGGGIRYDRFAVPGSIEYWTHRRQFSFRNFQLIKYVRTLDRIAAATRIDAEVHSNANHTFL